MKAPQLEPIAAKALEDCRQPHAREGEQLKGDAGTTPGRKPCHNGNSVEALPSQRSLVPAGPPQAENPGHIQDPDSDRAPGREAGEDAEEGHAAQIGEDAVPAGKPASIAAKLPKGP